MSSPPAYRVSIDTPMINTTLPIWGTALPDSAHDYGRWSVRVSFDGDFPVMQFLVDPEIVLHTGAKIDVYRGPQVIVSVRIL